jgi:hypothetical protein
MSDFPAIVVSHGAPDLALLSFFVVVSHGAPDLALLSFFVAMGTGGKKAEAVQLHSSYTYGILSMASFSFSISQ